MDIECFSFYFLINFIFKNVKYKDSLIMLLIFVSNKYVYNLNPIFEFFKQNIKMCVDKDVIICRKSRDNFQLFLRNFY